ncbi:MAG TPA: thermonuclease family protein, partial [Longimicrobiales bacterium]|nr:thermonuclease family protein [Longimicrobiales bacterium]
MDLNHSTSAQLQRIIHVGPARAHEIIRLRARRPFSSVNDLVRVKGIAPAGLADIRAQGLACVGEAPPSSGIRPARQGETGVRAGSRCVIATIVDGDTLDCADGRRIRLLLVDAPETDQEPFGAVARTALEQLAPAGTSVAVETDVQLRDRYGRLLAYLHLDDGRMVNEELLRLGVAVVAV